MSIKRIAIIFDNTKRPETTGWYCRRALAAFVGENRLSAVGHYCPNELDRIDPEQFDLYLFVDDGLTYEIPETLRPRAWWAIDTHLDLARTLKRAWECEFTFTAQRAGARKFQEGGLENVTWLPLACDPGLHRPHVVDNQWDIAFVGNEFPGERSELLGQIRIEFPKHFIGQCFRDDMAKTYSASHLIFNRSLRDDINMRVFEGLACGGLLLTNDLSHNGQAELFQEGEHYITYQDRDELLDKANYYLSHDVAREKISQKGLDEVRQHHTYRHRMESILRCVEDSNPPTSLVVSKEVPTSRNPQKANSYYEFSRPDVLELIPIDAQRVLDVGCGAGRLGQALKARQSASVIGIERETRAATLARNVLDEVWELDLEDPETEFPPGPFDAIVCADVLEHLLEPQEVLERLRELLAPDGELVVSLPNLQHHSVVRSFLAGNFTYEPAGILDEDHKRFFTRREIEKLFFRSGWTIEGLRFQSDAQHQAWVEKGRPAEISLGSLEIHGDSPAEIEPFYVYQYLFTAKPAPSVSRCLTSIILVTCNQWHYTRQCLESLLFRTDEPYEVIVVDNGSNDGTPDRLRDQPEIRLVENDRNLGFPAAVNQGLKLAQGEQIVLLNNDTLLTTGWLERLLTALEREPDIGLVGPCSNEVSGPQQIRVSYSDLAELDGFAWQQRQHYENQSIETDRLVGFCLMLKRELLDEVGFLDESFGIGCYEDDDYCRRAIDAGYRCVIARDAFIHHFGSRSFLGNGVDLRKVLDENHAKYSAKWNESSIDLAMEQRDGEERPRVSLCMIARDNESTIRPCLESIRPYVDEMIVVDTGSTDDTPEICRELGARVEEFPWCDDFSAARNKSLEYANGEWVFWMDTDDTIPEECGNRLRELVNGNHDSNILGYVMQVHCPGTQDHDVTIVDHIKLFRNRPNLRFEHRIHEQILPAIRMARGEVGFTKIHVVHSGSDHSEEAHERKLARDFRILKKDLQDHPNHPFVLFNLGMTYADAANHQEAVAHLKESLKHASPGESILPKTYALLLGSLMQIDDFEAASQYGEEGLALFPEDQELWFRIGLLEFHQNHFEEAKNAFQKAIAIGRLPEFSSVTSGLGGFKARHNLALTHEALNDFKAARNEWELATHENPSYRPAWQGLGELLLKKHDWDDAEALAETLHRRFPDWGDHFIIRARIHEAKNEYEQANALLNTGRAELTEELPLLQEICRLRFQHDGPIAALPVLLELTDRCRSDAAAWHNLAQAYHLDGKKIAAIKACRRSLKLRPDSPETQRFLNEIRQLDPHESAGVK